MCAVRTSLDTEVLNPDPKDLGLQGGLAVALGDGASDHALALGKTGRWLVRVLGTSDQVALLMPDRNATTLSDGWRRMDIYRSHRFGKFSSAWRQQPVEADEARRVLAPGGISTGIRLTKEVMPRTRATVVGHTIMPMLMPQGLRRISGGAL